MDFIAALFDLCSKTTYPIISIDGPAGAGKTTLASEIYLALATKFSVEVIHMDDLYNGWENALTDDLAKVLSYISDCHLNQSEFEYCVFDWENSHFMVPKKFGPKQILILEGVGAGQSAISHARSVLIWMDIEAEVGYQRVLKRDGQSTAPEMSQWLRQQEKHFTLENTKNEADFILST